MGLYRRKGFGLFYFWGGGRVGCLGGVSILLVSFLQQRKGFFKPFKKNLIVFPEDGQECPLEVHSIPRFPQLTMHYPQLLYTLPCKTLISTVREQEHFTDR